MALFVDREHELGFLEEEYKQDRASLVVIYGRRRIGKTTLIKHFIQNKGSFYFVATEESERENRRNFQHSVSEFTGNSFLKKDVLLEWEEIISVLIKHQPETKKVMVIDEFQYLGKSNSSLSSVFQKIWDQLLAEAGVMVILCGFLVGMMKEQTLSYSSPLYGRRTGQIRLDQILYPDFWQFFQNTEAVNYIEYYAVTGGVPKYVELFSPAEDIFKAIERHVLSRRSFLYEEPVFLLDKEFGETGTYFSLIKTIAAGNRKLGKIASSLGIGQSGLTKYLKTLQELDLVIREVPATEKNPEKSKKGLYRIKDNFISFWFRFIHPFRSYLEIENTEMVLSRIREQFRPNHVSFVYEDNCRQWIMRHGLSKAPHLNLVNAGRWWNKDNEIDLMGIDEEHRPVLAGECKHINCPVDTDVYFNLLEKVREFDPGRTGRMHYVIFSQSGFTDSLLNLARIHEYIHLETVFSGQQSELIRQTEPL